MPDRAGGVRAPRAGRWDIRHWEVALGPVRILVADDEEEILELLGEYLRARGAEVHTAYTGQEAVQVLHRQPIDVVLSDLKMPTMGGLDLLDELAKLPRPVASIIMTGFGTVEAAVDAMKRGASDFLLKPFRLREVYAAIEHAQEELRARREADRARALLQFYELAESLVEPDMLPRLYGTLAQVARQEVEAEEVAVWMEGPVGWEAVARGGQVRALARVDPMQIEDSAGSVEILTAPIRVGPKMVGLLAVAGGAPRTPAHRTRLALLCSVVGRCLERVERPR